MRGKRDEREEGKRIEMSWSREGERGEEEEGKGKRGEVGEGRGKRRKGRGRSGRGKRRGRRRRRGERWEQGEDGEEITMTQTKFSHEQHGQNYHFTQKQKYKKGRKKGK